MEHTLRDPVIVGLGYSGTSGLASYSGLTPVALGGYATGEHVVSVVHVAIMVNAVCTYQFVINA